MRVDGRTLDASPYAWPWDGHLDLERAALLAISGPGGSPPAELKGRVDRLSRAFGSRGGLTVPVMCVDRRRPFADVAPILGPGELPATAPQVRSAGLDGFFGSRLDELLRRAGRTHLVLVGTWLETSVHSTMRSANDRGYECLLLTDATAAWDPDLVTGAVSTIEMSGGIFGAVSTSAALLEALTPP